MCTDISNTTLNNCTVVDTPGFTSFDIGAYYLFRLTLGNQLPGEANGNTMATVDTVMTNPLIGAYIGFTMLILLNIFIAILTNTVNRVWETSQAFVTLQRALVIMNEEKSWSNDERKIHNKYLQERCNPYNDDTYNDYTFTTDDKIELLEQKMKKRRKNIRKMIISIEEIV
jgi:hypothetical protein